MLQFNILFLYFKELLLELESDSTLTHSISNLLKGNFFDKRALSWRPSKFEFVVNHRLTQEFERKFLFV